MMLPFLSPGPVPFSVHWQGESRMGQQMVATSCPRPGRVVIFQFEILYNQHPDKTQLYILTLGWPSEAVEILAQCLEAPQVWMARSPSQYYQE